MFSYLQKAVNNFFFHENQFLIEHFTQILIVVNAALIKIFEVIEVSLVFSQNNHDVSELIRIFFCFSSCLIISIVKIKSFNVQIKVLRLKKMFYDQLVTCFVLLNFTRFYLNINVDLQFYNYDLTCLICKITRLSYAARNSNVHGGI